MVSTPLKNSCQNGNLPQMGVQLKSIWNHHPDNILVVQTCFADTNHIQSRWYVTDLFFLWNLWVMIQLRKRSWTMMIEWIFQGKRIPTKYIYDIPFSDPYIMVNRLGFQMLEGFRQPSRQACIEAQNSIALNHAQKQLQALEHRLCINMMSKAIQGFLQFTSIT